MKSSSIQMLIRLWLAMPICLLGKDLSRSGTSVLDCTGESGR